MPRRHCQRKAIGSCIRLRLSLFAPQTCSRANVAWAFAAADVHAPELFDAIAETAVSQDELRTEDGLSLDMAQPSTKTAVEFDGPTHYLQGPDGPSLDGRTAFKRRLLGRLGWTCAAVPYFEWDPLLASGATEPYLRGVLARLRSE